MEVEQPNNDLDPRIQIELENLNTATEEINKLEIELEEANSTFNILYNESTRRLKVLTKKLGSCIEKSREYHRCLDEAQICRRECKEAATQFRRANEIHAAAKETVALAEDRFMTNSHNWPFDNTWQEVLNHATHKVSEAEKRKAEAHAEHQSKVLKCNNIESRLLVQEDRQRRNICKSRPYFEEKQLCMEQLQTQKHRIEELNVKIKSAKSSYAMSLKSLEKISEEIHRTRGTDLGGIVPSGPREPGVGATDDDNFDDPAGGEDGLKSADGQTKLKLKQLNKMPIADIMSQMEYDNALETTSLDAHSIFSEDKDDDEYARDSLCDGGIAISSTCDTGNLTTNSRSEPFDSFDAHELNLEELRQKVKVLAVRPVEGSDGQTKDCWENELTATVDKLDRLMMLQESNAVSTARQSPSIQMIAGLTHKPPKPKPTKAPSSATLSIANNSHGFLTPQHIAKSGCIDAALDASAAMPTASATKTFLSNSMQAMQQKMEDLLPGQGNSGGGAPNSRELPLLSRISSEITANTANTVKVLKRRLSLN